MTQLTRVGLAVALIGVDLVVVVIPLVAIGAAWILLAKPPAVREFVDRLYAAE